LFGRTKADPDNIWLSVVNPVDQLLIFLMTEWTERRRISANNLEAGKSLLKTGCEQFGYTGSTSIEVVRITSGYRALTQSQHQIRPINPFNLT
jgi:hypothetical protein